MYLKQGDYVRAVESLERGQELASPSTGSDMETISLVTYILWYYSNISWLSGQDLRMAL